MLATVRRQAGVALIELVTVMLVASLLWGGVLLVQSLVDRAAAHTLLQEMVNVKTMLYTYRDRYGAVPGDDGRADQHVPGAVSAFGTEASRSYPDDGMISSGLHSWANDHALLINEPVNFADSPEPGLFWHHLRHARIMHGDPLEFPVHNAVHGYLGIGDDGPSAPAGVTGPYKVCSSGIEGHIAKLMDQNIDDGDATTGKLFAAAEQSHLPVTSGRDAPNPYVAEKNFTVCMVF